MTKTLDVSIVLGPPPSWKLPITLEQLTALAARRADIEIRTVVTDLNPKKTLVLVVDPTGAAPSELFLVDGRLQIRNPSDVTLRWMLDLAQELDGRVSDNTCKTYLSPTETYIHPDDEEARKRLAGAIRKARKIDQAPSKRKRRWFDWFRW